MKNYINNVALVLIFSAALVSCGKDYLDTEPTKSTGADAAISTTANAQKALNGISRLMSTQHYYFGQGFAGENAIWKIYEMMPSESFVYNRYAPGWKPIYNQEFMTNTSSKYCAYAWYYYYTLIGNANTIIARIDAAEGTEEEKKFIKASALTFRAYSFEKLALYYCWRWQDSNNGASQGLVLRLDESTGSMPYSTLAETYTQIYTDLDLAISLYKASGMDRASSDVWLPNINVAHAVYARAALNKQDYTKALEQAKLAKSGYALMSNDDYHAGFCNPTSEWIFGSYGSADENNWYWSFGTQFACNGFYAANTDYGVGAIDNILAKRIPNDDARKALFLTEDKFPGYDFTDDNIVGQIFGEFKNEELKAKARTYMDQMAVSGLDNPYSGNYYEVGAHLKFYVFDFPGVGYLPFIRSSEMVLIEAEANYHLDKEADARTSLVELNKTTGRNPNYTVTKTGDALWNEIMDYRCLELWGEGSGWSDYKRWNRAIDRKGFAEGGNVHTAAAVEIQPNKANKWTWDVPQAETDYNDELL